MDFSKISKMKLKCVRPMRDKYLAVKSSVLFQNPELKTINNVIILFAF